MMKSLSRTQVIAAIFEAHMLTSLCLVHPASLTIDGLDAIDVILRQINFTSVDAVGVHQSPDVSRMRKSKGMSQLMCQNPVQVVI